MLTDGRTDGRKTGSLYRAMPEAGATKTGDVFSETTFSIIQTKEKSYVIFWIGHSQQYKPFCHFDDNFGDDSH